MAFNNISNADDTYEKKLNSTYNLAYMNGYKDAMEACHLSPRLRSMLFPHDDKKARTIVAMLFWNYRKIEDFNMRNAAYFCFREAFSILKENK